MDSSLSTELTATWEGGVQVPRKLLADDWDENFVRADEYWTLEGGGTILAGMVTGIIIFSSEELAIEGKRVLSDLIKDINWEVLNPVKRSWDYLVNKYQKFFGVADINPGCSDIGYAFQIPLKLDKS